MKTHDYTVTEWGHNCSVREIKDNGLSVSLVGWGRNIGAKDYILLSNGEDSTRYQISKIEYVSNPDDMWFAEAAFAPRES